MKPSNKFEDLVELVAILRRECPWDREQTHDSIKDNLIEEAYEAVEAIDNRNPDELKKELGDLLLHVLFHSKIASENSEFAVEDVIKSLTEKLIRRHPHVFENTRVTGSGEVAANWESIKMTEGRESVLEGVPKHLPALIRAYRMQQKASNVGFDWTEWPLAWEKLEEELVELKASLDSDNPADRMEEFGDLLFSVVNVGRLLNIKAEEALRSAGTKFERRFQYIEASATENNRALSDYSLEEMDLLWDEAKEKGL